MTTRVIAAACGLLLSACTTAPSSSPSVAPGVAVMQIKTAQGTYTSTEAATLSVSNGEPLLVDMWFKGALGRELWTINVRTTLQAALSGQIAGVLDQKPIAEGVGSAQIHGSTTTTSNGGTINATITNGRIEGSVDANPSSLSAAFSGKINVLCWVPRSVLGALNTNGTAAGVGAETPLVLDADLSSPPCLPFRALMNK